MPISEEEMRRLINALQEAVPEEASQPGRDAVATFLAQWRAEVEAGRPIDRKVKVAESAGADMIAGVARSRITTTGEFVGKAEYRPAEQLDLLLEALGLSYVAPPMMASRFLDALARYGDDENDKVPGTVSLAPTGEAGDPSLQIDRATVDRAIEAVQPLAKLLEELSREAGVRARPLTRRQEAI